MGGFLPPNDRSIWAACPACLLLVAAVRVQSESCFLPTAACVCQPGPHGCAGPSALPSTPPVESIPRLFPADSPARQFEFHIGSQEGKKRFLPPTETINFSSSASPPCLGCTFANEEGLNSSCHQPAVHPRGGLRLLQNWQPSGVTSPAHNLLWDTLVSCGTLTEKLLLATWL